MAEVVRQLSERLTDFGHSVTVATSCHLSSECYYANGVKIMPFSISGNIVNGIKGEVKSYEKFLLESKFDVVVNFAAQQWATDIVFSLLPRIYGCKVFVPTGFSGLYCRRYKKYYNQMPDWMKCYNMNVFHSDRYRDIEFARKNSVTNTILIPNGAAAEEFLKPPNDIRGRLNINPDQFLILHVGTHTGYKGHKESLEIFSLADIENAVFLLVGNTPEGGCYSKCRQMADELNSSKRFITKNKKIIIVSLDRAETVSAYLAADLFLFPSNIECSPIVLFESMASRTPFLTSNVGNCSEIIEWSGGAGEILPSVKSSFWTSDGPLFLRMVDKLRVMFGRVDYFNPVKVDVLLSAKQLEAIYRDKPRREKMSEAGFSSWETNYTWEKIALEYECLYKQLKNGFL